MKSTLLAAKRKSGGAEILCDEFLFVGGEVDFDACVEYVNFKGAPCK